MKKLLLLIVVLFCVTASALADKQIYTKDYTEEGAVWDLTEWWFQPKVEEGRLVAADMNPWDTFMLTNAFQADEGKDYRVEIRVKGSNYGISPIKLNFNGGSREIYLPVSTEWQTLQGIFQNIGPRNWNGYDIFLGSGGVKTLEVEYVTVYETLVPTPEEGKVVKSFFDGSGNVFGGWGGPEGGGWNTNATIDGEPCLSMTNDEWRDSWAIQSAIDFEVTPDKLNFIRFEVKADYDEANYEKDFYGENKTASLSISSSYQGQYHYQNCGSCNNFEVSKDWQTVTLIAYPGIAQTERTDDENVPAGTANKPVKWVGSFGNFVGTLYIKNVHIYTAPDPVVIEDVVLDDTYMIWEGPHQCDWGVAVDLGKENFAKLAPGDCIRIQYDKSAESTLHLMPGGWSGPNIPTYAAGETRGFLSKNEEAGTFDLNFTSDQYNFHWKVSVDDVDEEGNVKTNDKGEPLKKDEPRDFDIYDILKNSGLSMHGPCLVEKIYYIPSQNNEAFNEAMAEIESVKASYNNALEEAIAANPNFDFTEWTTKIETALTEKKQELFTSIDRTILTGQTLSPISCADIEALVADMKNSVANDLKTPLYAKISEAELYDGFAKTEESFAVLTTAIEAAKTAVSAEDATVESLEAAGKAIEDAIAGLTLAEGYEYLTADMFKRYASVEEPGEGESADCAFELLKATGMPYGDGYVDHLKWADLSKYDKLILTVKEGLPRIMMNRMIAGGNDADNREESNMLEMIPEQTDWSTQAYLTYENNVCTVNLKKIVEGEGDLEGYGFARLNVIKGAHWQDVLLTGLYLYKASDPLEMPKEALKEQIEKAKLYDDFAKTEESFAALTAAIASAEAEVANESATEESLAKASSDLADAIAGLTLAEGYEYLTADMFKRYASVEEPGEGTPAECAYDLFAAVNTPYGDGNVSETNWADLSDYDKFIVKMGDKNTPRVMMNRMVAGGNDSDDQEQSQMLEMVPNSTRWSTKAYTTYDEEENIFTIDLKKIVKEYGIARLNAIKYPWGVSGILTGLYLYKSSDPLEMPKEALKKDIEDAKLCDKYLKTDESLANLQAAIDAAEAELSNESATEESLAKASSDLAEAVAGLTLQPGYSELTKEMFKKYASVTDPGEGEPTGCDFNLNVKSGSPYGDCNSVGYLNWADLTNYDKLIITATEGNQRFCMNRLADGGQQGASMEESEMLDIQVGTDSWSATRYLESDGNVHTVDLTKMVDDYGFARLHTIKYSWGQDGIITNIYLYKDPEAPAEYSLSFNIDDPSHVVITVDGEEITDLVAGDNEKKIADRAKLSIAPAEEYILKTVTADGEDVTLKDGSLSKTIVKAFSFNITTDDADPLAKPKKALTAIIEAARLYDSYAKTEESFSALTDAIAAAETALESDEATEASLTTAGENVTKAIDGLKLKERYSYLTPEMFKQYASVEEPGEGEVTDCTFELFNTSRTLYGDVNNNPLKWADLSDFDELIIITKGVGDLPRFCIKNDSEGSLIEINPYDGSNDATEKYQTVNEDKTEFNVDLRKIAKDGKFAHLHSIQVNGWGTGAFVTGMYLYKRPFVAVTQVTLDQEKVTLVNGESVTLVATVAPEDATEPAVSWTSSNENVATVDADGKVTAVGVGNVTITATAGDISAECAVKCNPQLGDATLDGSITITDAVDITNYVVKAKDVPEDWNEAEWREFYLLAANANKDEAGKITFADASATAELALKQPVAAAMRAARRAAAYGYADSSDALVIGRVSNASYSKVTIPVSLENSMDYVALQADIILPEGMNIEVKAGERAAATHTLMTYKFADNHIRVALFNLGNNAFADNDAPILEIVADSYLSDCSGIVISNVLASDYKAHEYILDSRIGMSGVAGVNGDNILISKAADGVVISNATGAAISIFTLDGKIIRSFVAKDDEEMINLSSGIYVVKAGDKTFKVVL